MEVIAVDDGSEDGSDQILDELSRIGRVRVVAGDRRGAAAAVNTGVRAARFPIICQVDQDVIVGPTWMAGLLAGMADPAVGAVQGLGGYCSQQYGFGYGRLDVVAKHPHRISGDSVSPAAMMLHPIVAGCAVLAVVFAAAVAMTGGDWARPAIAAAILFGCLILERAFAGVRAYRRF